MAFRRKTAYRMRFTGDLRMTLEADPVHTLREQGLVVRCMRPVTRHALTGRYGRMHIFMCKLFFVVAVKAKFGHSCEKELFRVRLMGPVAAHALAVADRRMNDLLADDPLFFMTRKTEVGNFFQKKLPVR